MGIPGKRHKDVAAQQQGNRNDIVIHNSTPEQGWEDGVLNREEKKAANAAFFAYFAI